MALKVKKIVEEKDKDLLNRMDRISKEVDKKEKKNNKKENKKKEEKKTEVKKESWWHGVKSEFKKVRWPSKKEMVKYSIATIVFILFFLAFFSIIELIAWLIKTM